MSNIEVAALRTSIVLVIPAHGDKQERFVAHSPAEALDLCSRIMSAVHHIADKEEAAAPPEECNKCKRPKKSERHRCVGLKRGGA